MNENKQIEWSEVEEFLDNNLDRVFNFGNPINNSCCGCLMIEFFKYKDYPVSHVSGQGCIAYDNDAIALCACINAPFERIYDIHTGLDTGRTIKNNLIKLKNNQNEQ